MCAESIHLLSDQHHKSSWIWQMALAAARVSVICNRVRVEGSEPALPTLQTMLQLSLKCVQNVLPALNKVLHLTGVWKDHNCAVQGLLIISSVHSLSDGKRKCSCEEVAEDCFVWCTLPMSARVGQVHQTCLLRTNAVLLSWQVATVASNPMWQNIPGSQESAMVLTSARLSFMWSTTWTSGSGKLHCKLQGSVQMLENCVSSMNRKSLSPCLWVALQT